MIFVLFYHCKFCLLFFDKIITPTLMQIFALVLIGLYILSCAYMIRVKVLFALVLSFFDFAFCFPVTY